MFVSIKIYTLNNHKWILFEKVNFKCNDFGSIKSVICNLLELYYLSYPNFKFKFDIQNINYHIGV